MYIGADYYPEHWPRERWATDAALMREAGFTITRLAEFAWSRMEPSEGVFDFGWLDDAIDVLGAHGIKVILCTPTPTVPKWLYDTYPETTIQNADGTKIPFGNRQNVCFTSPAFREFSRRITRAMAEHFAGNPHVVGWQLDNEFHGPNCYCAACEAKFQAWLADKYTTTDALNEAWGTDFWSHRYTDFGQTHLPRNEHSSPSLVLDYRRFHSQNIVSFAREQADILRQRCPGHFITHNEMGWAPQVDYYDLSEPLDIVAFDYYYNYGPWDTRYDAYTMGAAALDLTRGFKRKNFMIMENSAGAIGWESYSRNLRPGEMRRMTYQNVAHGADGQVWFRWRTSRYGTEQYWHGLLGHDGLPQRRYDEAAQTAKELRKLFETIDSSTIESQAAIVSEYDDRWALAQQPNAPKFDYIDALMPYYRALHRRGVNVDFINLRQGLESYKLVVLPYKYLLNREQADRLEAFVAAGGTLIVTCRSGVKNAVNVPHDMTLPGYLRGLTGVRVEEYESLPETAPYKVTWDSDTYTANTLADWIIPETAQVLASYDEPGVAYAAVTKHQVGSGCVYYIGTIPDAALANRLTDLALVQSCCATLDAPEHVEVSIRSHDNTEYVFLLNHTPEPQTCTIMGENLLDGKVVNGSITLPPDGVAVVQRAKA